MTETLANGYSSASTQRKLSNEYQHDRVMMDFKNLCILVLWKKVASALEGLTLMLVVAELANTKLCKNTRKIIYVHSSEGSQQELSNAYQLDRV